MEGYGLTETSGASSLTDEADPVAGHVGGPLECVKFRLRDVPDMNYLSTDKPYPRGELIVGGGGVADGYYNMPELTESTFYVDQDKLRWVKTGDIGTIVPGGGVKIIDRKKDLAKLQHGEYISLGKIESILKTVDLVEHICVLADANHRFPVALVVPTLPSLLLES